MIRRAVPALVVITAGFAALVVVGRDDAVQPDPFFATPAGAWMPAVTRGRRADEYLVLPGRTGDRRGRASEVRWSSPIETMSNSVGNLTVLTPDGPAAEQELVVEPWSRTVVDVDALVTAPFASVVVEIEGGTRPRRAARHPSRRASPSRRARIDTSDRWYFADGFTVDGSIETLILTNPYDDTASVDLRFATLAGESKPAAFQGFTVPPRSVRTIPIAELGARDEPVIAVEVAAERGRLVVGRAQHFLGGGRLGYDVTLAAPALRDQFWFADGELGEGVTETFAIYNPTDSDVAGRRGLPRPAARLELTVTWLRSRCPPTAS